MSYPDPPPASKEYAYIDPKTAHYGIAKLPEKYHPLDAWKTLGRRDFRSFVYVYWTAFGIAIGLGTHAVRMYHLNQPIFAQLGSAAWLALVGGGITYGWTKTGLGRATRRDAIIQDYLETHYEDFPLIERRKFKDEFRLWTPVR